MRVALVYDMVGGPGGGGGIARAILELGLGLREKGHRVVVVCHDFTESGEFEQLAEGLEVRAVRPGVTEVPRGKRSILDRYWRGMRRLAEHVPDDTDVVHAHNLPALRAGRLAARRVGAPLIWTRYDDTIWERGVIPQMTARGPASPFMRAGRVAFGLSEVRDVRRADEIVVMSDFDSRMVRRAYRRRATVIRSGPAAGFFEPSIDRTAARRVLEVDERDFLVLGFALLTPHRRFEDLIEAAAILRDEPRLQVLIAGTDSYVPAYGTYLAELIRTRNLEKRVTLQRRSMTDEELRALYVAADLFVFPTSRQSYGLAPLEAIASGTPVVVSAGAGVHEILEGQAGVTVVPPGSPGDIAAAIRGARAATDHEGFERTRLRLRKELSRSAYAESIATLYERAARARRSDQAGSAQSVP
jgi:glycosyltransferase involved in cell wall biosynthesis